MAIIKTSLIDFFNSLVTTVHSICRARQSFFCYFTPKFSLTRLPLCTPWIFSPNNKDGEKWQLSVCTLLVSDMTGLLPPPQPQMLSRWDIPWFIDNNTSAFSSAALYRHTETHWSNAYPYPTPYPDRLIDWVVVLRPTRHEIGHFIWAWYRKKLHLTQQ